MSTLELTGALNAIAGTTNLGDAAAANSGADRVNAISRMVGFGDGVQSGNYYALNSPRSSSTNALPQSALRLAPVVVTKRVTIDRLAVDCVTGAALSTVRILVYGSNDAGDNAGALLYDSTGIASTASGVILEASGVALTLNPGVYWFGTVSQGGAPTLTTAGTGGVNGSPITLGTSAPASGAGTASCVSQASVTGSPPDPYAGSASNGQTARVYAKVG